MPEYNLKNRPVDNGRFFVHNWFTLWVTTHMRAIIRQKSDKDGLIAALYLTVYWMADMLSCEKERYSMDNLTNITI